MEGDFHVVEQDESMDENDAQLVPQTR